MSSIVDEFVPTARPVIGEQEIEAAVRVLRSGAVVQGPEVAAFEEEFADIVGGRHCVAVNSGASAIQLILLGLGIGPGDEVIVPSFSFAATANAVRLVGAEPVFADISPGSFCLDPDATEAAITPRTAAIMPVHLYGHPADMDRLAPLAERGSLAIVEDAAQAHGALVGAHAVGTWGAAGFFSSYPTKNMHSLEAGMVMTADAALARMVRLLRNQGMEQRYANEVVGANMRLTDVAAAIGRVQLAKLAGWNSQRRANAEILNSCLTNVVTPPEAPGTRHVYQQYTVRVPVGRDALQQHLTERRIGSAVYYPTPIHRLKPYWDDTREAEFLGNCWRPIARPTRFSRCPSTPPFRRPSSTASSRLSAPGRGRREPVTPARRPDRAGCDGPQSCPSAGRPGRRVSGGHRGAKSGLGRHDTGSPGVHLRRGTGGARARLCRRRMPHLAARGCRAAACRRRDSCAHRKPLAPSVEAARRLVEAFESRGLVAGVGHIERFNPALQNLHQRLELGGLGDVFQVVTRRQGPFPHRIADVGVVMDLATHDIDLTAWVTGRDYVSVAARTVSKSGSPHEDMVAVVGQLADGRIVSHLVNWLSPLKERYAAVTGARGCFVADTLSADLTFYANGAVTNEWEAVRAFRGVSEGDMIHCALPKREPLLVEHERFRDAVAGVSHDIVTLAEGLRTVGVAAALLQSLECGVALPAPRQGVAHHGV